MPIEISSQISPGGKRALTFNDDLEFLGLHLEVVLRAAPDLADPSPRVPQLQVGHLDRAVVVGVHAAPRDPPALHVDPLAHDVRVQVGRLPAAEMHLALARAVQDHVVAHFLRGGGRGGRGRTRLGGLGRCEAVATGGGGRVDADAAVGRGRLRVV